MKTCSERSAVARLLAGAAPLALSFAAFSSPAHAIVSNDNVTPEEAVDEDDEFRGVGMFFRSDGSICTGTLINPRTVLFAAHCVNNRPEEDYDTAVRSAFSFNVNALPGFQNWFRNGFQSNPDASVYNINRIYWNSGSTIRGGQDFVEGDVAIASLDTPATNVPIWSVLFSPLPAPDQISDADGTGYHVNITGYGRSGQGSVGDVNGVDWRRRSAENMLGALTSFDSRNTFLFGRPANLPQVLYRLDFDDPNKTNPFDFNLYKDEPRVNEGTTAGGDSGGPLILDAANNLITDEDLVIGVLSGGSRFFGGQVFSSYGTESFYQPLFLFWDYIAANNPYRYVTAKSGDGDWEDASHWETTLDPSYRIIDATGAIVNGIPTSGGNGITGDAPEFGEVCFDPEGASPAHGCQNLADGTFTPPAREALADLDISSGLGTLDANLLADLQLGGANALSGDELAAIDSSLGAQRIGPEFAQERPAGSDGGAPEFSAIPNPAPTLGNGLPGASDFVPDNIDPVVSADPAVNVDPRYFDVTLGNDGTTRLNSSVVIDRLTVRNNAGLYVAADADLTSLIDVSQFGGSVNIDGDITSVGDYTLFGGFLGGNGTLSAPFVTSIMGAISPGGTGSIGTFTIDGNAVLSSGSTLMIDIGDAGSSDTLAVTGDVSIGGVVALGSGITGVVNGNGEQYTILTAGDGILDANGEIISTFTAGTLSPILSQSFIYQDNAVLMQVDAASYTTAIDTSDPVQAAYAQLLDQNRSNSEVAGLYGLDFASAETIQATLSGLAPVGESAVRTLAAQNYSHLMNFNANRLRTSSRETSGGTIATLGNPLGAAETGLARSFAPRSNADLILGVGDEPSDVKEGAVPDNMAIFFAGGLVDGKGDSMPGFQSQRTDFDGYFLAGGVEVFPNDNTVLGASIYHANLDADVVLGGTAESSMWAGSFYGRTTTAGGINFDAQLSLSDYNTETARTVSFLGNSQTLLSDDNGSGFSAGLGVSYDLPVGDATITPGVEARYANLSFGTVSENGGVTALTVERERFKSFQSRVGFDARTDASKPLQVNISADYVHEFEDGPQVFQANFRNGSGAPAAFALATTDQDWLELGIGASLDAGGIEFGIGMDSTVGRSNAEAQTYTASATIRF